MHVNTKKLAFSGLTLALTVMAIVLSGILEMNTLFLLAAAAFLVGIIIRECGLRFGSAFYLAAILLGLILAPNKLYCITFAALGFYILAVEFFHPILGRWNALKGKKAAFWLIKYLIFNLLYLPALFFFPKLFFTWDIKGMVLIFAIVIGQMLLLIYDKAYDYFQLQVWGRFRKRLE